MRNPLIAALESRRTAQLRRKATAYSGAAFNRMTASDWRFAGLRSVNHEIRFSQKELRSRARDLARNDPYAVRFVSLCKENIIGPHGVQLQAQVRGLGGQPDRGINRTIEDAWWRWQRQWNASADRRLSWVAQCQLAVGHLVTDGEALIRMLPGFGNEFGFSTQVFDPDQLDVDFNRPRGRGENEIRMGIELDEWGGAVAYHLWDRHPYDPNGWDRQRIKVPASQMIHLFVVERAGQVRGVTRFAPIIITAKQLSEYQVSHLMAARAGTSKMGFFTRKAELEDDPDLLEEDETDEDDAERTDAPFNMEIDPLSFTELPEGLSFQGWDPQYPVQTYPDFVKSMLRTMATGWLVSYNTLANDLEGVNYSSIRAGLITERDVWMMMQTLFIETVCEPIYPEWMKWALTTGALRLPSVRADDWLEHAWRPRGWKWVDPLKDVAAAKEAIALGLGSRTEYLAEQGKDLEETLENLRREMELAADMGLDIGGGGSNSAAELSQRLDKEEDEERAEARRHLRPVAGGA